MHQEASEGGVPITTQLTDEPPLPSSSEAEEPAVTTLDAVLDAGDLIDVQVFDTPELSGKLRVNGSGAITLQVGGSVAVQGRTADQARVAIEQRFREQNVLRDPHVEVYLLESASQSVTVTGEVRSPGVYSLHGRRTVLDFVSLAGGVNSQASDTVTLLHQHLPAETVNLGLQRSTSPPSQVVVQPGDKIVVERSGIVYVVGDVGRPGGYLVENRNAITVLQALALAQGINRTAKADALLIRTTPAGRKEQELPLKRIFANQALDPTLLDGDILYVPVSGTKAWAERSVNSILQMAVGVVIYGRL
jgi:polysaccharide export outer membrane protein